MSPVPGRSTLMTSAPSQASSWVQVGPDCTCVMSRTRTPSSAFVIDVASLVACWVGGGSLVHRLGFGPWRVLVRVDPDVDDGRAAVLLDGSAGASQGRPDLGRVADLLAIAAKQLPDLRERHVAELVADVAALG